MNKTIVVVLVLLFAGAIAGLLIAEEGKGRKVTEELQGRQVAEVGDIVTLSGTLTQKEEEWYLIHEEDRYMVHFGRKDYVEGLGLDLSEGAEVTIRGFLDEDEISVIELSLNRESFQFRDEEGRPQWSGRGRQQSGGAGNEGQNRSQNIPNAQTNLQQQGRGKGRAES